MSPGLGGGLGWAEQRACQGVVLHPVQGHPCSPTVPPPTRNPCSPPVLTAWQVPPLCEEAGPLTDTTAFRRQGIMQAHEHAARAAAPGALPA